MRLWSFIKQYMPFLIALLPVLILRDFAPSDELRFISIANEARQYNHWFAFTYQDIPYADVQPLYIWFLSLFKAIFGHHYMWSIGLLSLLPALGILWVMNRWVTKFGISSMRLKDGSQSRTLAQYMLSIAGFELMMSVYLRMEMLFSLSITLALYNFWKILYKPLGPNDIYSTPVIATKYHHHNQLLFALYTFLAVFTQGATGLYLIFISTTLFLIITGNVKLWWRVWNWRVWGVLVLLFGGWFYGVYWEAGQEYLEVVIDRLTTDTTINALAPVRPWYYFLLTIWIDTLPFGPICIAAVIYTLYKKHILETDLQVFYLLIILVTLVMFSCFSGKLDVYLLPCIPYIIYLGVMQFKQWRWPVKWHWTMVWVCRIVLVCVFIGGLATPWINLYTGSYGELCSKAKKIHAEQQTEHYYVYKLHKCDGMDAYLQEDPIKATPQDIADGKLQNTLLLIEEQKMEQLNKELDKLGVADTLRGKVVEKVGPYRIIRF